MVCSNKLTSRKNTSTSMKLELQLRLKPIKLPVATKESSISHLNWQVKILINKSLLIRMPWLDIDRFAGYHKNFCRTTVWCRKGHNWNGQKILRWRQNHHSCRHSSQCWYVNFPRPRSCQKVGSNWAKNLRCYYQDWYHGQRYWCKKDDHESVNSISFGICWNKKSFSIGH